MKNSGRQLLGIRSIGDRANSRIVATTKYISNNKTTTSMIIIMFVHGKYPHLIEPLVKPIWTNPPLNQVTSHTLGPFNILGAIS